MFLSSPFRSGKTYYIRAETTSIVKIAGY